MLFAFITLLYLTELVFHNNAWKTATQVVTERTMTSSVAEVFPCSSGTKHQKMEQIPPTDETPVQQVSYWPMSPLLFTSVCVCVSQDTNESLYGYKFLME